MNFAAASGLALGLIALPIVAFYLLKIKRHRRTVPYLKLWADLVGERHFNTLFQRLQRWLSLALQLLIALCLVGAFAVLTLSDSYLKEESVVLIVDTSASMNGLAKVGDSETRIESALVKVRDLIEGRSAEDEFAIIAAGPQPEVLQGFTRSTLRLREGADALQPSRAVGDLEGAVRLARDLLQNKKEPRILMLTDAAGGAAAELEASDDVSWVRIGESVPNVAIRRFQVRKNFALGTDYLLLVVANEADEVSKVTVEVYLGDVLRVVEPLELAPREVKNISRDLTGALPRGGFAKAVLVPEPSEPTGEPSDRETGESPSGGGSPDDVAASDGLDLDNVAYAAVAPTRAYKVLLVTRDAAEQEPFKAALDALDTLVDRQKSAGATPAIWAKMTDDEIASYDLVLFVHWAPETPLPARGRYFAINALPAGLPATAIGIEQSPSMREVDADHPLNRFLEPKSLTPSEARPLDLTGGQPFLATQGGPVGVVFADANRKVVYLGLDVLTDLFFLQVAFPLLLRNALAWMHEDTAELLEPTYRPGDVVRPRFALADTAVEIGWQHEWADAPAARGAGGGRSADSPPDDSSSSDSKQSVELTDGRFEFSNTQEPGRYWVRTGSGEYRTAVNLFAPSEADLTMPDLASVESDDVGIERSGFLFGRDLWPLLLLIAAALWVLEWTLYHRRITQ